MVLGLMIERERNRRACGCSSELNHSTLSHAHTPQTKPTPTPQGGHGALTIALKNPGRFKAVSAFAPICNPVSVPWGHKAFAGYLGGWVRSFGGWMGVDGGASSARGGLRSARIHHS